MPPASKSLKNSLVTLLGAGSPCALGERPVADGIMKSGLACMSLQESQMGKSAGIVP